MTTASKLNPSPIFPNAAAHLRSLAMTMAVMCYLAGLAVVSLLIVQHTARAWAEGLSHEATVQLQHLSNVDEEQELTKALALIKSTRGVISAAALDKSAGAKLLEPWLGKGVTDDLPIPRLIRIAIDEHNPPDFAQLEATLTAKVKGVSLDTHRRWQAQLSRMGTSLVFLASLILALITLASVILVSYTARGVIAANTAIIEVLELVGAEPRFISRQNDKQFFTTGLFAGVIGMFASLLTCAAVYYGGGFTDGSAMDLGAMFNFENFGERVIAGLALVPLLATLIAVWVSRLTLLQHLKKNS